MGRKVECIHKRLYDGIWCIECGKPATDTHHMVFGKNRANAERWGLTCSMCRSCHSRLHDKDEELANKYRKMAQAAFEYEFDHELWLEIFGKNYL